MGKSSPPPPDYGPLAQASKEAAEIAAELGREQLDFAKTQYDDMQPLISGIAESQMAMQDAQMRQGEEYYDYLKNTYRPLEQEIVADARAFNTEAEQERQARLAAAESGQALRATQQANERAMASMGVNPNSGRFQGQQRASDLQMAAQRANAMTGARERADAMGRAMKMDAAGLGRNLPGASTGAYSAALNAGNSASSNAMAPGQQYMQGLTAGAGTIMNGQAAQMQGLTSIYNGQNQSYIAGLNNQGSWIDGLAGIGMAAGSLGWTPFSSKQLKTKTGDVDAKQVSKDVEKLPIDQWQYKPGVEDGGKHIGPYAEDMDKMGAGAKGGKAIDMISAMGLNLAASKGLSERVSALEKKQAKKRGESNV